MSKIKSFNDDFVWRKINNKSTCPYKTNVNSYFLVTQLFLKKWFKFFQFMPIINISVNNSTKMSYGSVKLDAKLSLLDLSSDEVAKVYPNSKYPVTFESFQQYSGFILYETTLPDTFSNKGLLIANNVHDRALVYVNRVSECNEQFGVTKQNQHLLFI